MNVSMDGSDVENEEEDEDVYRNVHQLAELNAIWQAAQQRDRHNEVQARQELIVDFELSDSGSQLSDPLALNVSATQSSGSASVHYEPIITSKGNLRKKAFHTNFTLSSGSSALSDGRGDTITDIEPSVSNETGTFAGSIVSTIRSTVTSTV
uniref:Uncharacterized protein n=1 Tax=Plectus sambesii TaxID=2011161 RepID=A0A914X554_9BILA